MGMCGRYTLSTPVEDLAIHFAVAGPVPPLVPRYNVAPSQLVAVVGLKPDGVLRGLARLQWGLLPYWSPDGKGVRPINARAETLLSKPTFRESFLEKRCLIPADGFYEWRAEGRKKYPHHFRLRAGGGVMAFAGLWDCWRGEDGRALVTCCIVTLEANEVVKPFHDRMPAVIGPDAYTDWLAHGTPVQELQGLLRTLPTEYLEVVPANPLLNSPKHDSVECLIPPV